VSVDTSPSTVVVAPDADVSSTISTPASVLNGGDLTYTVTVSNGGPSSAWGVAFTDSLPYETAFLGAQAVHGSSGCTVPRTGTKGGTVSCQLGMLASGASTVLQITVQVLASATQRSITDVATAIGVTPDPLASNNTGTAQTAVTRRATTTAVTCQQTTLTAGESTTCTATVTDTAPAPLLTPTGSVRFTSSTKGDTFTGSPCKLSGTNGVSTCQVSYAPGSLGTATRSLTASYSGDKFHSPSKTKTGITVAP
jgi:uncharacterized repeat protein (TIGR01451 family)